MEKYVSSMTCADFIVSTPDYFRYNPADEFITPEQIGEIAANTKASLSGTGYAVRNKPRPIWDDRRMAPAAKRTMHCKNQKKKGAGRGDLAKYWAAGGAGSK